MGTSEAPVAFQSDAQMSSRFTLFEIPRWTENDDFRRLLRTFEQALPLRRPSDLVQRPIVVVGVLPSLAVHRATDEAREEER